MSRHESGIVSPLLIITIVLSVLLLGVAGFSGWAFTQYMSYKNDADVKIASAVAAAKEEQTKVDQTKFEEQEKLPTRQLVGPEDLGKVSVDYPKTWSVYVEKNGENGQYEAYLYPGAVPAVSARTPVALRVTIQSKTYQATLDEFKSLVDHGDLTATPVKIGETDGLRLDGTFNNDFKGSMVVLKVRDKTLKVYTQLESYKSDFNDIVLPSLKFNR